MSAAAATPARRSSAAAGRLLGLAHADLTDDLDELRFLCADAEAKLTQAARELRAVTLLPETRKLVQRQLTAARHRQSALANRVCALSERARGETASRPLLDELAVAKASLADLVRTEQALLAPLLCAADWQSPSFLHALRPAAGRQQGRIRAHWNDYKRDRHLDADAYERRYVEQLVEGPPDLCALLTSCGMAAFTTILCSLQLEGKLERPVLAGAGLYHESKLLLARALPGRVRFVEERDTRALLAAVDELEPGAIFLDSLSNTARMPIPELAPLLERLRGSDSYLILDNTGLSVACQPFARADDSVRLIVFESLLKYAQLGLDRANAGVIVARPDDAELLSDYREHLGTNISDVAAQALPRPNRRVLERRLARLQRNALHLAHRLSERAPAAVEIVHPGLASHPCARTAAALRFRGGCLSIVFGYATAGLEREQALVEAAVAEARRRGVPLLAGSSFGFDTSRIYLTAARAACGEPFVRIAAGSEHRLALEPLADALTVALEAVFR